MPVIKIRTDERDIIDQIAQDADSIQRFGLQVQPSTAYATQVAPSDAYTKNTPIGSDTYNLMLDAFKVNTSAIYRRVGPLSFEYIDEDPVFNDASSHNLIDVTLPFTLEVPRTVQLCVNFGIHATVILTTATYWIDINDVESQHFKRYFETDLRGILSGNWIVDLPANAPIKIKLRLTSFGAGTVGLTPNQDFISLTFMG